MRICLNGLYISCIILNKRILYYLIFSTGNDAYCGSFLWCLRVLQSIVDKFCNFGVIFNISWAQKTLQEHWSDERERLYSLEQLEASLTYDPLWNAAQTEMVRHVLCKFIFKGFVQLLIVPIFMSCMRQTACSLNALRDYVCISDSYLSIFICICQVVCAKMHGFMRMYWAKKVSYNMALFFLEY